MPSLSKVEPMLPSALNVGLSTIRPRSTTR